MKEYTRLRWRRCRSRCLLLCRATRRAIYTLRLRHKDAVYAAMKERAKSYAADIHAAATAPYAMMRAARAARATPRGERARLCAHAVIAAPRRARRAALRAQARAHTAQGV